MPTSDCHGSDCQWAHALLLLLLLLSDSHTAALCRRLGPSSLRPFSNVSPVVPCSDGSICLDLLQDKWSPCQSVSSLLTSIQSLLTGDPCIGLHAASEVCLHGTTRLQSVCDVLAVREVSTL